VKSRLSSSQVTSTLDTNTLPVSTFGEHKPAALCDTRVLMPHVSKLFHKIQGAFLYSLLFYR
jgi:hypothetical protein